MKATTVLFVALAAAAFAGPASAVFKCTTAKGVVYQDRPCLEGSETDVRLTVPSGQIAPKVTAPTEDTVSPNRQRVEDRTQTVKLSRSSGDSPTKTTKRAEEKAEAGASDSDARRKDAPALERTTPMTPDQARKTEPSAKYYSM